MRTLSKIGAGFAIAVCFFVAGCGGVGAAEAGVPAINQIVPQTVAAGSGNTTVEIVGSHISDATVVLWNGSPLSTTLVNDTTVATPVESASLAFPGTAELQLMNSVTGVKSAAVEFNISSNKNNAPALSIATTALPAGTVGKPYSVSLTATGGSAPYSWSFTSGRMPAGLSLDASGVLSGTPTAAGTFSVGLTLKDKSAPPQQKFIALTLIIAPAAVSPLGVVTTSLPAATYAASYSQTLQATGGTPSYGWAISSGSLPPGLSLSSTGVISGKAAMRGSFPFTATAKDSSSPQQSAAASLSITVVETPVSISTTSLAAGTAGTAYSQTLSATGGAAPYTWSVASGSLPPGVGLGAGGSLSGTPTSSGTFTFTASVSDASNPVQTRSITLSIAVAPVALKISQTSFALGFFGRPYMGGLQATGGTPGYSWSVASGSLPAGLTLNNTTGAISGTPSASGTAAFTAIVNDTGSPAQTASALVSITIAPTPLTITASTLLSVNVSSAYSQTLQAIGGTAPYQWSIRSGSLPAGLTLSPATGTISGTPSAAGTSTFTAIVTDSSNPVQTASVVLSILVNPSQSTLASVNPLSILAPASTSGTAGSAYSRTLGVTGGTSPYTWSVASGSLPAGLTLSSSGVVSGTLSSASSGSYGVTVSVSDSETPAQTASATMTIAVSAAAASPLQIVSSTLASGTAGSGYTQAFQATGGTPAYAWSVSSGSLPSGLSLSSSGVISGTPSVAGTSTFTATVTDSGSPAQSQSVAASISITAAQASNGTTWYVRPDGGTRYDSNVPNGQCNGQYDAPYPGSGGNQNCAFNDFRYMWDDGSLGNWGWVITGGDTVVIRGCAASANQQNPSSPDCRIGYDSATSNSTTNAWCWYAPNSDDGYGLNQGCYNPPIPAGTSGQHTRILGACAYGIYTCNPVNTYPYTANNLTQIFSGFGAMAALNLKSTQYVDVEGLEITTHNDGCISYGAPAYPKYCNSSASGGDDYGVQGVETGNTSANITLQDVYIHGFSASGLHGPIGGAITLTRVFSGFNGFAGWNFQDNADTPDAVGSTINASYVWMEGNGCNEQYPIVNTPFPAKSCYDDGSNGFGDSWSGQDTTLASFTCDHCSQIYNTKDGFIGPHAIIASLTITNSQSIGNMGQQWKWTTGTNSTTLFENNLTVGNCGRMAQQIPGAAQNFAQSSGLSGSYLSDFCRASGDMFSLNTNANSTELIAGNTEIGYNPTIFDLHCGTAGACGSSPWVFQNDLTIGYGTTTSYYPFTGEAPGLYYMMDSSIIVSSSYNVEYGVRNGDCAHGGTGILCTDPLLANEPAQGAYPLSSVLDISSVHPAIGSPVTGAGTPVNGLTTDYYGSTRPVPPSIGAVEP